MTDEITTMRSFVLHKERYDYDFGPLQNWVQYDTKQDASYFGVWVEPERRLIFTFAEGDETLMECHSREAFIAELGRMAAFYGPPPPMAIAYDKEGNRTEYYDTRPTGLEKEEA
jgi:hypothetical protein